MPRRRLSYDAEAADAIRDLHPEPRRRVKAALEAARDETHLGKELRDELAGLWSLRVGRLRIIYREARGAIQVIDVGPRDTIYEDVARRLLRGAGAPTPGNPAPAKDKAWRAALTPAS